MSDMRTCNGCTMCCETAPIVELGTSEWERCPNCTGDGCGIYASRPDTCRGFECLWLRGSLPDEYWPKRCGVMAAENGFAASRPAPGVPAAYIVNFWANRQARDLARVAKLAHEVAQQRAGDSLVQMQLNRAGQRFVWDAMLARWVRFPPGALVTLGYHRGKPLAFEAAA